MGSRLGAGWVAVLLLLLSLGLPWTAWSQQFHPGSGPTCIADLSGEGGLICDYISVGGGTRVVPGLSGGEAPARFFLVLAIVLVLWALASGRRRMFVVAGGAAVAAVALGLPAVLSGQVVALLAAAVLFLARAERAQADADRPSSASNRVEAEASSGTGTTGANRAGRSPGWTSSGR